MTTEEAIALIDKKFGKGSIMNLGDMDNTLDVISTGCIALDKALGVGGFPRGRIIEMYSEPSVGKSSLALSTVIEAQKQGKVAYLDSEFSLSEDHAKHLGVDTGNLVVFRNECAEDNFEVIETLTGTEEYSLIIVDSVASLVPRTEISGDYGDSNLGVFARLMGQALRKLTGQVSKANTCLMFINQTRHKIGVMYGSPVTTPGGKALEFYASIRIALSKDGVIKENEIPIGHGIKAKIVKNKVAEPGKIAEFEFLYSEGISKEGEILELGSNLGIIKKGGSYYSYEDVKIGQGKEKSRQFLKENVELRDKLEGLIRGKL